MKNAFKWLETFRSLKFRYQPADKLGKLLRGRKDTFAPAVSRLRGQAPPSPPRFWRLWVIAVCNVVFRSTISCSNRQIFALSFPKSADCSRARAPTVWTGIRTSSIKVSWSLTVDHEHSQTPSGRLWPEWADALAANVTCHRFGDRFCAGFAGRLFTIRTWNYFRSRPIPTCVKIIPQRHRQTDRWYNVASTRSA